MHYKQYKNILSAQNGINIYRGCLHGCIYCDSRSKCYQMQHDFEDIEVKQDAPKIFEEQIKRKRTPCMIGTGSMCDPYMPIEKELQFSRKCLEVINKYGFGVTIITKSDLILRDLNLLKEINKKAKCVVQMTLTTYDEQICKIIEPNVCSTKERFEVLKILNENGIPTVVWLCPFLPYINDNAENLKGLLEYCKTAKVWGILNFGIGLTLREGNREYFYSMLDKHFPQLKEKYIKEYGNNYVLTSANNNKLIQLFINECKSNGIVCNNNEIFKFLNTFPEKPENKQLSLFDF